MDSTSAPYSEKQQQHQQQSSMSSMSSTSSSWWGRLRSAGADLSLSARLSALPKLGRLWFSSYGAGSSATNPFADLDPNELRITSLPLELVLYTLEMIDRPNLVPLLTVSRAFFEVTAPLVWRKVDHIKELSDIKPLERYGGFVHTLSFNRVPISEQKLEIALEHCPNLKTLEITDQSGISVPLDSPLMSRVLRRITTLQYLSELTIKVQANQAKLLAHCTHASRQVDNGDDDYDNRIGSLGSVGLRSLNLNVIWDLDVDDLIAVIESMAPMRSLSTTLRMFGYNRDYDSYITPVIKSVVKNHARSLQYLALRPPSSETAAHYVWLLTSGPVYENVTALNINNMGYAFDKDPVTFIPSDADYAAAGIEPPSRGTPYHILSRVTPAVFPKLAKFIISGRRQNTASTLQHLSWVFFENYWPHLTSFSALDFHNCEEIMRIISNHSNLRTISLAVNGSMDLAQLLTNHPHLSTLSIGKIDSDPLIFTYDPTKLTSVPKLHTLLLPPRMVIDKQDRTNILTMPTLRRLRLSYMFEPSDIPTDSKLAIREYLYEANGNSFYSRTLPARSSAYHTESMAMMTALLSSSPYAAEMFYSNVQLSRSNIKTLTKGHPNLYLKAIDRFE
ncbi:hypothetical protein GQ42DRAFT_164372 [Ramicandelaber brevisporus]|nr:hypothetical protein GQ42DRAFT_164372 [Ramicandelaber brevisporus]